MSVLSRIPRRVWRTGGMVVALGIGLIASGNAFRAASQGQTPPRASQRGGLETRGFLIAKSDLGIHYGKFEEDCPQGFEKTVENIFTVGRCCKGTPSTANNDCASEHKTLAMLADGYPDPDTGQCTMISSATNIVGTPVFITSARGELSSRK